MPHPNPLEKAILRGGALEDVGGGFRPTAELTRFTITFNFINCNVDFILSLAILIEKVYSCSKNLTDFLPSLDLP